MNKKLIITNESVKARAIHLIEHLPSDEPHEVIIRPHKRNRSLEQNAYYWKVVTIMADELGNTKDELHAELKRKFLTRIFVRDDPGYADMAAALRAVKIEEPGLFNILSRQVIELTSTTKANVKQMSEYIDDVCHFAASLGIRLPAKEYEP